MTCKETDKVIEFIYNNYEFKPIVIPVEEYDEVNRYNHRLSVDRVDDVKIYSTMLREFCGIYLGNDNGQRIKDIMALFEYLGYNKYDCNHAMRFSLGNLIKKDCLSGSHVIVIPQLYEMGFRVILIKDKTIYYPDIQLGDIDYPAEFTERYILRPVMRYIVRQEEGVNNGEKN